MSLTLQIVLTGLAAGSVYGLLAVGNTLVFRLTGIVHFALGDLVGLGVFVALLVTSGRGPVTQASASSWRFALALAVGLVVTAGLSAGSYSAFIHPYVVRGSTVGWVAASVAIAFAIEALLRVLFIRPAYVFPDPIPFHRLGNDGIVTVGGATFQARSLYVIALGVVLAAGLSLADLADAVRARSPGDLTGRRRRPGRRRSARSVREPRVRARRGDRRRHRGRGGAERAVLGLERRAPRCEGPRRRARGRLLRPDPGVRRRARPRRRRGGDRERRDLRPLDRPRVPRGAAARVRADAPRHADPGAGARARNERARADDRGAAGGRARRPPGLGLAPVGGGGPRAPRSPCCPGSVSASCASTSSPPGSTLRSPRPASRSASGSRGCPRSARGRS